MPSPEDDFTFPTTTTASADWPPHFIGSPPLWQPREATRPNPKPVLSKSTKQDDHHKDKLKLCLLQEFKSSGLDQRKYAFNDEEEEKMDMLWEDLNEEIFPRNSCGRINSRNSADVASSPGRPAQVSCIKALKFSKANGHDVFSRKKSNFLVFVKIVKKVFVIHNSRRSIKKWAR